MLGIKSMPQTIPCRLCGELTEMLSTKLCDSCCELERRVEANPALTRKILNALEGSLDLDRISKAFNKLTTKEKAYVSGQFKRKM